MSGDYVDALVDLRERRRVVLQQEVHLRYCLKTAVRKAVGAGMSEVEAAKLAGVTRMTVRAWLGKGK